MVHLVDREFALRDGGTILDNLVQDAARKERRCLDISIHAIQFC